MSMHFQPNASIVVAPLLLLQNCVNKYTLNNPEPELINLLRTLERFSLSEHVHLLLSRANQLEDIHRGIKLVVKTQNKSSGRA